MKQALADLDRAVALAPDDIVARFHRGMAHRKADRPQDSIADFSAVIAADPDNTAAFTNRAILLQGQGETDKALADYSAAIKLEPGNALARIQRAGIHAARKDHAAALADYDAAIAKAPTADLYERRAALHEAEGDLARAVADHAALLKLDPQRHDSQRALCLGRAVIGPFDAALEHCDAALERKPLDLPVLTKRGLAHLQLGHFDRVIADYTEVLRYAPRTPEAVYGRGLARIRQGDVKEGEFDLAVAKTMDETIARTFADYGVK